MAAVPPVLQAQEPIQVRCHVFQTAKDAPVVPGKPTVIRVYADWIAEDQAALEEQEFFYDATVRVNAGGVDLEPQEHTFWRPDHHSRQDSVTAALSANFFGWRPAAMGSGRSMIPVRATVEIESPTSGEIHDYRARCPVVGLAEGPVLNVDYYFVRTREWLEEDWDEVGESWEDLREAYGDDWPGEWEWIKRQGHGMMGGSARFALRTTPFRGLSLQPGGELEFHRYLFPESDWEVASTLYEAAIGRNPDVDMIVGIVPPSLDEEWDGVMIPFDIPSGEHFSNSLGGKRIVLLALDFPAPRTDVLAHEIGHFYGLCHTLPVRPEDGPPTPGPRASIPSEPNDCVDTPRMRNEGFFLSRYDVLNKSETEGNGEMPEITDVPVIPVMDSGSVVSQRKVWWRATTNEHYDRLIRNLTLLGFYDSGADAGGDPQRSGGGAEGRETARDAGGPAPTPFSTATPPMLSAQAPRLLVTGMVHPSGEVVLAPFRSLPPSQSVETPPGPWELEVLDAAGSVLESVPFEPRGGAPSHGTWSGVTGFRIAVARRADASEIVIRSGSEVRARSVRSDSEPLITILSPESGDDWEDGTLIRWQGTDPDGDNLVYEVSYSADGVRWAPLALNVAASEFQGPGLADLDPGPSPTLRITAFDGFHVTEQEVSIRVEGGFRILTSSASRDDTLAAGAPLEIAFNRGVDPGTVSEETLRLRDDDGDDVAVTLELDDSGRVVTIAPGGPLVAGARYQILVEDDLSDRFGNRLDDDVRWRFRTAPDRRRPRVLGMDPRPGALGVDPSDEIRIRFDEPIDPETLDEPGATVRDAAGASVDGAWRYDPDGMAAVFAPSDPLASRERYQIGLGEAVTDRAGNPLARAFMWTFTVAGQVRPRSR